MDTPKRRPLPHRRPEWAGDTDPIFITLCTTPRGLNQLAQSTSWHALESAAQHMLDRDIWMPHLLLAMPDHLHLLVTIPRVLEIARVSGRFKRCVSHECDVRWQRESFDHRTRNRTQVAEIAEYIRLNPVRAGLVSQPEHWPYIRHW